MKKMKYCTLVFLFLLIICSVSLAQETAFPRKGEGVYSFLLRNNRPGKECYEKFVELNRNKLGQNETLVAGVKYQLPDVFSKEKTTTTATKQNNLKKRKEPLFGKENAEYIVESDRLKGACFFLVSGHGGPDPGAVGKVGSHFLHEDEYAYDVTLRLARALLKEGATVHIIIRDPDDGIRDDKFLNNSKDETCMGDVIPLNQTKRLQQQCDKINGLSRKSKSKYQRAIFIHLDSRSEKQQIDVFFYHHEKSKPGERMAKILRTTFQTQYDTHQPARGFMGTISSRGLYVLSHTKPVAVFAELGNIRNQFDQKRFLLSSNRQAVANWMCRGIIKDYENERSK